MKCQLHNCKLNATTTWALVPVCTEHKKSIFKETRDYYGRKISKEERKQYQKISHLIPWANRD